MTEGNAAGGGTKPAERGLPGGRGAGKKYFFETYGCQMNQAESAALRIAARERGWTEAAGGEDADLVLLHTCAVRATAEERVLGRLAQYEALKKKRAAAGRPFTLAAAGCMAQRWGPALKERFPGLDWVMGIEGRAAFTALLAAVDTPPGSAEAPAPVAVGVPGDPVAFAASHLEEGGFRSFIPIMHGCDNFCSYCIVPYLRGREISRDPASIIEEIRLAAGRGVREITLLGQNVNSYRWTGPAGGEALDFPGLLRLVAGELAGGPVRWARFLSSHPKDLSPEAIAVMAGSRCYCRHLHLCVQHGSNPVLARMNRRYTREQYLDLVARLRAAMPGLTLSTDILVGFPGETEEDLEATLALMNEVRFLYAYMYHYNPREGTAAFALPDRVPEEVKRRRLGRVIELQKRHTRELLESRLGTETVALVEGISRKHADEVIARTERDEMVVFPGSPREVGRFRRVRLESLEGNTFRARGSAPAEDENGCV